MAWMFAVTHGNLPGQIGRSSDHALSGSLAMDASAMHIRGAPNEPGAASRAAYAVATTTSGHHRRW
jgi:hypothetical protein